MKRIFRNPEVFAYLLEGNRVRETAVRVGATFGDMVEIHPLPFYGKSSVEAGNRGKRGAFISRIVGRRPGGRQGEAGRHGNLPDPWRKS